MQETCEVQEFDIEMKLSGSSQPKPEQERAHGMIEQMRLVMLPRKFSRLVCQRRIWNSNPCHLALQGSSIECTLQRAIFLHGRHGWTSTPD